MMTPEKSHSLPFMLQVVSVKNFKKRADLSKLMGIGFIWMAIVLLKRLAEMSHVLVVQTKSSNVAALF